MVERLTHILKTYQISASKLADMMGVQRSGVSHILSGRNKPSFDFLQRLLEHFPEVDANWLLTGKGKAFLDEPDVETIKPAEKPAAVQMGLFDRIAQETLTAPVKEEISSPPTSQLSDASPAGDDEVLEIAVLLKNGKFRHYRKG
jgi:transcriptional regulator with XRE-family HTH domain